MENNYQHLQCEPRVMRRDAFIIVVSIACAVVLVKTGVIEYILNITSGAASLESFVAGLFFTSIFTTAPAIAVLGEIAQQNSIWWTAFFGGVGALLGDLILFRFVKENVSQDFMCLLGTQKSKRFKSLLRLKVSRWVLPLIGAFIIASPFPDEIGLALMGFSKMKTGIFVPVSFFFNFLGIVMIGLVARALL